MPEAQAQPLRLTVSSEQQKNEGEMMISTSFDLNQFIEAVRDKDYFDIIYFADREATEAERVSYRKRKSAALNQKDCKAYVNLLKGLILFMRHGIKAFGVSDTDLALFSTISRNRFQRRH
jgi:hypothetical protein